MLCKNHVPNKNTTLSFKRKRLPQKAACMYKLSSKCPKIKEGCLTTTNLP